MRRSELARVKIAHIDSQRMIIHVVDGKGHKDRDLPLSPTLLETPACLLAMAQAAHLSVPVTHASRPRAAHHRQDGVAGVHRSSEEGRHSQATFPRTWFATRGPRICSKPAPTCAPSSFCSAMRIWR